MPDEVKKVPSKEDVLFYLRERFEDDPDFATESTDEIAHHFGVDHSQLYDHAGSTGPLYELLQSSDVMRMESGRRNPEWTPEPGKEFEWVATNARIVWPSDLKSERKDDEPLSEWQPIETLPKDGTVVLCIQVMPNGENGGLKIQSASWNAETQELGGRSWCYASSSFPIHWKPIGELPTGYVQN